MDGHFHIWTLGKYPSYQLPGTAEAMGCTFRDFTIEDYKDAVKDTPIRGGVFVNVANENIEESKWLCQMAKQNPIIRGVVAGLTYSKGAETIAQEIKELRKYPQFVGSRSRYIPVNAEEIVEFYNNPITYEAIAVLEKENIPMDLVRFNVSPYDKLLELPKRFPKLKIVIDHCANPSIIDGKTADWTKMMQKFAEYPNVFVKISGLVTEAMESWTLDNLRPYITYVVNWFKPDRCFYGSDWPVLLMNAKDYTTVYNSYAQIIGEVVQCEKTKKAVFETNCARIYEIKD